jgi:hypothetical protein
VGERRLARDSIAAQRVKNSKQLPENRLPGKRHLLGDLFLPEPKE